MDTESAFWMLLLGRRLTEGAALFAFYGCTGQVGREVPDKFQGKSG